MNWSVRIQCQNSYRGFCFRFVRMAGPRDSPHSPLPSPRGVPGGSSPRGVFGGSSPRGVSPINYYQSPGVGTTLSMVAFHRVLVKAAKTKCNDTLYSFNHHRRNICPAIPGTVSHLLDPIGSLYILGILCPSVCLSVCFSKFTSYNQLPLTP